jgi:hypothetical protein
MGTQIRVLVETTPKKVFVSALDWPGWSRGARDESTAVELLLAVAPRYAEVAATAGLELDVDDLVIEVAERLDGDAGTAFGVPAVVADADRRPVDAAEAVRQAALVGGAWSMLDRIAAAAPEALRKGPRGGGRDRSKVVAHVIEAEAAYAQVMGRKHRPGDPAALAAMRADLLAVLREPSDGTPLAGKRWPPRYAARRIAWHALDHAWEIEDRTDPAG